MTAIIVTNELSAPRAAAPRTVSRGSALMTLARRRFALSARAPREIIVPLLTPILFALVIAPALAKMVHGTNGLDYKTFVAIGTVGLLVPLRSRTGSTDSGTGSRSRVTFRAGCSGRPSKEQPSCAARTTRTRRFPQESLPRLLRDIFTAAAESTTTGTPTTAPWRRNAESAY